jgi:hypothetical protein
MTSSTSHYPSWTAPMCVRRYVGSFARLCGHTSAHGTPEAQRTRAAARSRALFAFVGKRGNRMKALTWAADERRSHRRR